MLCAPKWKVSMILICKCINYGKNSTWLTVRLQAVKLETTIVFKQIFYWTSSYIYTHIYIHFCINTQRRNLRVDKWNISLQNRTRQKSIILIKAGSKNIIIPLKIYFFFIKSMEYLKKNECKILPGNMSLTLE